MSEPELTVERDGRGFWRPDSEDALRALLRAAARHRQQVRVRGAGQSVSGAIYTDGYTDDHHRPSEMNVLLDRYAAVRFESSSRVAVQAGCHLGRDPHDPHGTSSTQNGLLTLLDRAGLAFNTLGGITHQTVGGFFSTGSSGGTLGWSAHDAIRKIRLIDAAGVPHDLTKDTDPTMFYAAGVSLGLLGVVSEVTFECVPRFDIVGRALSTTRERLPVDLLEDGALERFFRESPYARMLWWPQPGVDRVALWSARRMEDEDYTPERAPGGAFEPKAYRQLASSAAAQWLGEAAASAFYTMLGTLPDGTPLETLLEALLPHVIKLFVHDDGPDGAREFWDTWHHGLAMDNQVSSVLLPTDFSEMWFPVERATELARTLQRYFEAGGERAMGAFTYELSAARRSPFWLHPAHGRDSVRLNLWWFARNHGDPARVFYPRFWELLRGLGGRFHWGRYMPDQSTPWSPDAAHPERESWADHLRALYPRWGDFMRVREGLDPEGRFLTGYWRSRLGL